MKQRVCRYKITGEKYFQHRRAFGRCKFRAIVALSLLSVSNTLVSHTLLRTHTREKGIAPAVYSEMLRTAHALHCYVYIYIYINCALRETLTSGARRQIRYKHRDNGACVSKSRIWCGLRADFTAAWLGATFSLSKRVVITGARDPIFLDLLVRQRIKAQWNS